MKNIITRFVGRKSFKIVILGIVKSAVNVATGGNGIVKIAISVLMALVYHANIAASQGHFQILNKRAEHGAALDRKQRRYFK